MVPGSSAFIRSIFSSCGKTADRENPNRWATVSNNRAPGAVSQNRSCSIKWAAKQEKVQPAEKGFFLTSPFIGSCEFSQPVLASCLAVLLPDGFRHECCLS